MFDFHTHTFLSDGVLSPIELVRRAHVRGYRAMAITDHVGAGNLEFVVRTLIADCKMASSRWDIRVLPGVEITHVPPEDLDTVARDAKKLGAKIVIVHGETIVEPVAPGTNEAAVKSSSEIGSRLKLGALTSELDDSVVMAVLQKKVPPDSH